MSHFPRLCWLSVLLVLPWAAIMKAAGFGAAYRAELLHPTAYSSTVIRGAGTNGQVGQGTAADGAIHALRWSGTANSVVDLHPPGFTSSVATSVFGAFQAGSAVIEPGFFSHAILWSGSPSSAVDLHPTGFSASYIQDITSTGQIGAGHGPSTANETHALLWRGSSVDVVDLHPPGFDISLGNGIWETVQVGQGSGDATGRQSHALLWTGAADSVVDLHPEGLATSFADSIWGNLQVESGLSLADREHHALLWSGSAESFVDLNPVGMQSSFALGVANSRQVGYGYDASADELARALLWRGSAASAVDLHPYVTSLDAALVQSVAFDIDEAGTIFGYAAYSVRGPTLAVKWTPIPEPRAILLIVMGLATRLPVQSQSGRLV